MLPIDYKSILSHQLELKGMNNFHISPTNLESTSLLLLTG